MTICRRVSHVLRVGDLLSGLFDVVVGPDGPAFCVIMSDSGDE
jgi:hypothetical protein